MEPLAVHHRRTNRNIQPAAQIASLSSTNSITCHWSQYCSAILTASSHVRCPTSQIPILDLPQKTVIGSKQGFNLFSATKSFLYLQGWSYFFGRQCLGGHNVIWGLHCALKIHNPNSVLLGFLGGSEGLFAQKTLEITDNILSTYKNQGGYDLLGRTKDQIRTTEQVNAALAACNNLKPDGWLCHHWRCDIKHRCYAACRNICCCKKPHKGGWCSCDFEWKSEKPICGNKCWV